MSEKFITIPLRLAADVLGALFNTDTINPEGFESVKQEFAALMRATPAQPIDPELSEPTAELVGRLRDYAGEPGYSHNDYADTMKQAAYCIEQLVGCVDLYQRRYAESFARKQRAQPIADVSAPTDLIGDPNKEAREANDNFLHSTIDAKVWADEYCHIFPGSDHGLMIGWFANAIMVGFDEGMRRAARAAAPSVSAPTDERAALPDPDTTWYAPFSGASLKYHSTDQIYAFAAARAAAPVSGPTEATQFEGVQRGAEVTAATYSAMLKSSRAKVLEEAALYIEQHKTNSRVASNTIAICAESLRELASCAAPERSGKPADAYECQWRHENGTLMPWQPLEVDSDDEANSRIDHGRMGVWRKAYQRAPAEHSSAAPIDDTHAFKNFHRALCERFGYAHDERDWRRDQVSLIEHIDANHKAYAELRANFAAPSPTGGFLSAYYELIYAVGNKCPNETRHQTALRYIRQAEEPQTTAAAMLQSAAPTGANK